MNGPLKILIKYPSRGRKDRFFKSLDSAYNNLQDMDNFHISCTLDSDDKIMNCPEVIEKISSYKNTSIEWGKSESKVDAVNRNLPQYGDIILVHSDDMLFTFYGFDTVIRDAVKEHGLDMLYHIPDNDAKSMLATMYIAGRYFYNRFRYIYNPIYKSLFCDNEIQDVAQKLGKYKYVDFPGLIFHANSAYGHSEKDEMFIEQQEIGWSVDQQTYNERKLMGFNLDKIINI